MSGRRQQSAVMRANIGSAAGPAPDTRLSSRLSHKAAARPEIGEATPYELFYGLLTTVRDKSVARKRTYSRRRRYMRQPQSGAGAGRPASTRSLRRPERASWVGYCDAIPQRELDRRNMA